MKKSKTKVTKLTPKNCNSSYRQIKGEERRRDKMRGDKIKQDKNRMILNFTELYSNSPLLSSPSPTPSLEERNDN